MRNNLTFPCRLVACLTAGTLMLSSCAPTNIPNVGESCYYRHCVEPLVEMQKKDSALAVNTAKSAAAGALAGAVIGIIIATATSKGAALPAILIGLGAGALGGAAIGYTYTKMNQISDENTRFASVRVTANQDLSKANRLQLYSYESITCYIREFDRLQEAYESGVMPPEEYAKRFEEIHRAMVALGEVIGNMDSDIQRTEREFNNSFTKVPFKPEPVSAPAPAPAPSKTVVDQNSSNPRPTPVVRKPRPKHTQRAGKRISELVAKNKKKVEQTQAKNDDDLGDMLETFAGKVTPPPQSVSKIKQQYGQGYSDTRQQINDLRAVHREAMSIMNAAANEAGIDMV